MQVEKYGKTYLMRTAYWGEHCSGLKEWHSIYICVYLPDIEGDLADLGVSLGDLGDMKPGDDCVRLWSDESSSSEERLPCASTPRQDEIRKSQTTEERSHPGQGGFFTSE